MNNNNNKRNLSFNGTPLSSYRGSTERQNRSFHSTTNHHKNHHHSHSHISNHTKQHGRWGLPSQPPPQNNRFIRFQDNRSYNYSPSRSSVQDHSRIQFHNNRSHRQSPQSPQNNHHNQFYNNRSHSQLSQWNYPPSSLRNNTIPPPTRETVPWGGSGSQQRVMGNNLVTPSPPSPHKRDQSSTQLRSRVLLPPPHLPSKENRENMYDNFKAVAPTERIETSVCEKQLTQKSQQEKEKQHHQKQCQQHDGNGMMMPPPPPRSSSMISQPTSPPCSDQSLPKEYFESISKIVKEQLQLAVSSCPPTSFVHKSTIIPPPTHKTVPLGSTSIMMPPPPRRQDNGSGMVMPPPPRRRDNDNGMVMPPPAPRRDGTVSQPTPQSRAHTVGPIKRRRNETTVPTLPTAPATPNQYVQTRVEEPIVARTKMTEITATTATSSSYPTDHPAQVEDQSFTTTPLSDAADTTDTTSPTGGKIHVIFAIDRSGSMRKKDITGGSNGETQTRWDAVFTCAAEFIKEQTTTEMTNGDNHAVVDDDGDLAFSLILFEDSATLEFERRDPHAALREMERVRTRCKPQNGTNYGAAWENIYDVSARRRGTNGNKDKEERQWIVFLSDGRPAGLTNCRGRVSDYVPTTLNNAKAQKAKYEKKKKKKWTDLTGVVSLEKVVEAFQPTLHFICIHNDGKTWMQQLAAYFKGSFHMAELRLDTTRHKDSTMVAIAPPTTGVEETELHVLGSKSAETLRAERFKDILARQSVIHLDDDDDDNDNSITTPGTMRDTFRCISTALTTMRRPPQAKQLRERLTNIHNAPRSPGSIIKTTTHPATLMVLDETKSKFVVPPDESRDGRLCHIATWPFAQGGLRNVYDIREEGSSAGAMVAKESRHIVAYADRLRFHLESYRCHLSASSAAFAFNGRMEDSCLGVEKECRSIRVTLLDPEIYRLRDAGVPGGFRYLAVEEKLEGIYTKYNSNNGFVKNVTASSNNDKNGNNGNISTQHQQEYIDVAQCFSHFSYVFRKGKEIVVDIQGVGFQYTDPQIHSLSMEYGLADRGQRGIDDFFKTHVCNSFCRRLHLPVHSGGLEAQKQKKQHPKRKLQQKKQQEKRQRKDTMLQDDIIDLTDD